ncbi:MAG: hypothetical protein ABR56_09615 [Acidimicrobium sp. BACL27 MAG-120823-bin4]|nr:MAG: hypothetical protein ABR56_09615 [Acidimicrobium sp. BACL27 MAG-120823-bin4]
MTFSFGLLSHSNFSVTTVNELTSSGTIANKTKEGKMQQTSGNSKRTGSSLASISRNRRRS